MIEARDLNSQIFPPDVDPLNMRNSLVNTLFISSTFRQFSNLNVINSVQWIRNSQAEDEFDDGTQQEAGVLSTFAMVNRLDYTINAGNLNIRPMFKHLLLREHWSVLEDAGDEDNGIIESYSIYAPIVRTRFRPDGQVQSATGISGLPFLAGTPI